MKSTWTQILLSTYVLTLVACSGGGGGGGGGISGDTASPNPTISNPPTKASGTPTELVSVLGAADTAGAQATIQTKIANYSLPTANLPTTAFQTLAATSCVTGNSDWKTDADKDHFLDSANVTAKNCDTTSVKGGGGSSTFDGTLKSTDSNTTTFWADANISFSGKETYKDAGGQTDGEYYYSFKSTLDMNKGALTINAKDGGYDKTKSEAASYSASWLTFTATEAGAVSLSGYIQEYAEGKGLVTLQVTGTGGTLNETSKCIENLVVTVKFADGSTAATVTKTLCLSTAPN